jgi:hypothetical protein
MPDHGIRIVAATMLALAVTACAVDPKEPVATGSAKLWQYFEAKQKLAADLQKHIGGTTGNETYRLVAINGPSYPVGALVSADNPLDLESRACIPDASELPEPEPWSAFPSWNADSNLDLSLAIPAHLRGLFNRAQSSLDAGITIEKVSTFALEDIAQVVLSREELRETLASPQCRDALEKAQDSRAIFVRGLVYGQETLKSARSFQAGLGVRIMEGETGQFSLQFDRNGAFELAEQGASPKFAIVAQVAAPVITAPSSSEESP